MAEEKLLALPGSSWDTAKKIIRAFYAVQNEENPKLEAIARYAAVPRPVISMNNNFLRSVGLVRDDQWKLTEKGLRYATALQMNNTSMTSETLGELLSANPIINQLLRLLLARGEMKVDTFRAELILRLGISPTDRRVAFVKPLLEMLQEGELIRIDGDSVNLVDTHRRSDNEVYQPPPQSPLPKAPEAAPSDGLPLLLGPNRIVYVRLPSDWVATRDLPKLLKLLEISLGEDI
jgi:hypothetical protein